MKRTLAQLLALGKLLIGIVTGDPEIQAYLNGIGFPLSRLAEGLGLIQRAEEANARRNDLRGRQINGTGTLTALLNDLRGWAAMFRFAAQAALDQRGDLLAILGLHPRGRKVPKAEPAAATAVAPAAPAEAASGSPKPAAPQPRKERGAEAAAFLEGARAAFTNALGNEEVLSAMEPLGFSRQAIESLLSRVGTVEQAVRAQEEAKGFAKNAGSEAREAGRRLRRWFTPWRRQVRLALKPMPRLLERVKAAEQGR